MFESEPQIQSFIADTIAPLVKQLELPFRRDEMGNLIVEIGPRRGDRSLMLMAYAMTHPTNRMKSPFAGEIIESGGARFVRGRGVSEQKGSLAAALGAVKAAATNLTLNGSLVFTVSTAGETGRHDAAESICAAVGAIPRAAVVVIGTTNRVALANKGRIDIIVTVKGKAAHSSTPWAGVSAIEGARRVLDKVLALGAGSNKHSGLGQATLTPTSIRSWPEATHTVQDEVRLVFDRRLLPGDDPQAVFAAVAAAADIGSPWSVETTFGPFMHPAEAAPDGPLVSAIRRGCEGVKLPSPPTFYSHGALDAGYFHAKGAEATMWGPGDMDQWHSEDERISVDELQSGARAYFGLIREYLCN
ncbi:MAG: M20/M25/M40 family metallo-hydrolase [Xanthobacteraceae bacterium]|nr:M20/M25/M40 family metallo-hydrolase [Xanthobacteraceae bacterium]